MRAVNNEAKGVRMGWRDLLSERVVDSDAEFEEAFAREILISERVRAQVLCGLFIIFIPLSLLLFWVNRESYAKHLLAPAPMALILGVFVLGILYEYMVQRVEGMFLAEERRPPDLVRYINAVIESFIPTAIMLAGATAAVPVYTLLGPASVAYFILIVLSTLRLNLKLCVFTGLISAAQYSVLAYTFIDRSRDLVSDSILTSPSIFVDKGVMMLIAGGVAGFVALQIKMRVFNSYRLVKERNRLVNLFGQQVSQAIVDEMIRNDLSIGSKRQKVCVMFLDIRNFTPFAERRNPEEIVSYLNTFFTHMIEIVNRNDGIINQFLGDGFMATFGAPVSKGEDCANAVRAAVEIVEQVREMSAAGRIPETRVGIGLHAGEAVTGNVGSSIRQQYSITGNVVILASRIEQLNKVYDSQLLVSGDVIEAIGGHETAEAVGPVRVKGHEEAIQIFRLA